MHNHQFTSKILYKQIAKEDELTICKAMLTLSWYYPQAASATVVRCRIIAIYDEVNGCIIPNDIIVDQWKSDGWTIVDTLLAQQNFKSTDCMIDWSLKFIESFYTGIPVDDSTFSEPDEEEQPPSLTVLEFPSANSDYDTI